MWRSPPDSRLPRSSTRPGLQRHLGSPRQYQHYFVHQLHCTISPDLPFRRILPQQSYMPTSSIRRQNCSKHTLSCKDQLARSDGGPFITPRFTDQKPRKNFLQFPSKRVARVHETDSCLGPSVPQAAREETAFRTRSQDFSFLHIQRSWHVEVK